MRGSRPVVHGVSKKTRANQITLNRNYVAKCQGYLERAAATRLIIENGRNLARFPFSGRRSVGPGDQGKILHGRIVAPIQARLLTGSCDSAIRMSRPLTRFTIQSVMLFVLQCETASSPKEIPDLVKARIVLFESED